MSGQKNSSQEKKPLLVIGKGAWGEALGHVAELAGNEVLFWRRGEARPDPALYEGAIVAVPAQAVRPVMGEFQADLVAKPLIISAKGIERESLRFMNEVVAETVPEAELMVLSGPSFAADVMQNLPTAVTLAARNLALALRWGERLASAGFRVYGSDDIKGVEIGGALKNVLAIACGIAEGQRLGNSARAALTTRGFAELTRLGVKLGARAETLTGLSGLGDLLLTCSSPQSRNYAFGLAVGRGLTVAEALAEAKGVVEGAYTAAAASKLAKRHQVDMPIVAAVTAIVEQGASPGAEIQRLLLRPLRHEVDLVQHGARSN